MMLIVVSGLLSQIGVCALPLDDDNDDDDLPATPT